MDYYPLFPNSALAMGRILFASASSPHLHLPRQGWNLRSYTTLNPPFWNISTLQQNVEMKKNPGFIEWLKEFSCPLCMFQAQGTLISEELRREIGFKYQFSVEMPGSVLQVRPNIINLHLFLFWSTN